LLFQLGPLQPAPAALRRAVCKMTASERISRCTCSRVSVRRNYMFACRVSFYLFIATLCNFRSTWSWTYEPMGFQCKHPKLPVNNTGIKVLIYAVAKTGTTTMTQALRDILPHTWHSEDFYFHLWAPLSDEYWSRSENGGGMFPWQRLATPAPPAYKGFSYWSRAEHGADARLHRDTPRSVLAERLSQCGVQAMAFDGVENLFWDVLDISPDAKVVMLNWRDYPAWDRSRREFGLWIYVGLFLVNLFNTGQHILPWNAVTLPFVDMLTGNTLLKFMESGRPLQSEVTWQLLLFRMTHTERKFIQHWSSGLLPDQVDTEAEYNEFWERGKREIPKDRLLEFSLKDNTMMDLCKFLGFKDHPACTTAPMPKSTASLMTHETAAPHHVAIWTPYFLFIHWVNYSLFLVVAHWVGGKVVSLLKICGVTFPVKKNKMHKSA